MLKQQYEIHPAATLFPLMTEKEYQGLKQDIAENGQREDIVVWCGKLIDGRNRLRACEELHRQPSVAELDEDSDPWKYVISHNLHRRHLSETQRETVAAKLADMKHGGNRKSEEIKGPIGTLIEEAAEQLNVSERNVKRAKAAIKGGCQELVEAMERDEINSSLAAKFVKAVPDKKEQAKILKQGIKAVREAVKPTPIVEEFDDEEVYEPPMPAKQSRNDGNNFLAEFKDLWSRADTMGRHAIRVWLEENN